MKLKILLAYIFLLAAASAAMWYFFGRQPEKHDMERPQAAAQSPSGQRQLHLAVAAMPPVEESKPAQASDNGSQNFIESGKAIIAESAPVILRLRELAALIEESVCLLADANEVASKLCSKGAGQDSGDEDEDGISRGKVEKGDTIAGLLENADNSGKYVKAAAKVFPLRSFRAGQAYTVFKDPGTGRIRRFEYEVNDACRLIVEGDENPCARIEDIEYETRLQQCESALDDSLFQAVADIGEKPQLALKLVDLFGSEINFIRDIRPGDSFSVLVEKRFREGEFRGYGRVLAARFTTRGKTFEAWLFRDAEGRLHHYNAKGENLKKTLLMAPLAVTRLTSRFTHARKHPILGKTRPHLGVDYGAPTGTPVKAVGHGTVTRRGWAGGYGNQIILKHEAGLESMYAHLSGFARGLKNGQSVKQGQVIGYVGSTGLSTGPHLDFRLRQNGEFINPAKAINPRGAPVAPGLMAAFKRARDLERKYLEGGEIPDKYALDSIVPAHVSLAKAGGVKKGAVGKKAKNARRAKSKVKSSVRTTKRITVIKRNSGKKHRRK